MNRRISGRTGKWAKAFALACLVLLCVGTIQAAAASTTCSNCGGSGKTRCPVCAGTGLRTVTTFKTQVISFNPYQTIMIPVTTSVPCTTCGGSGKMICPSCGGTGRRSGSSSSSSSGSGTSSSGSSGSGSSSLGASASVKYGTVLDATDGIGDYEDAPNLLDGNVKTKFNVKATSLYIIWKAPKKIKVSSYVITTANDTSIYKGRNPKTWILYGSNKELSRNEKGWKKIHAVTNDKKLKATDYKKFTYKLKKASAGYQYFKLEIKANKGADCTQLSEFTLKGKTVK